MSLCIKPTKTSKQRRCERKKRTRLLLDKWLGRDSNQDEVEADRGRCDEYNVLKLAVEYDSTFCKDHGGNKRSSENKIRELVGEVNAFYLKGKPCITIDLIHLDGQCDSNNDLWKDTASISDAKDRLDSFREKFGIMRADINAEKTVAHLYTGSGTSMDKGSGIAYTRTLCRPEKWGFGTLVFADATDTKCPIARNLIVHELGHNIGVEDHAGCGSEFLYSVPFCYDCDSFTKSDLEEMVAGLKRKDGTTSCLKTNDTPISIDILRTLEPLSIDTDIPKTELGIITEHDQIPDILNVLPIMTTVFMMTFGGYILSKFRKS